MSVYRREKAPEINASPRMALMDPSMSLFPV